MTPRRRILLSTAAAGHLVLVVLGGLHVCLWEVGPIGKVLTYYSAMSGADSGYAFFAPRVGSPPTVEFTIVDDAGRAFVDALPPGITREADIRVEDLVEVHDRSDDVLRAQLAASWAAAMFSRHPRATSVTVDMGFRRVPTMADRRRGKAARWRSVYRARVLRSPRDGAADGGSP